MLPSMAAGLGSILFAITIDNPVLNTSTDPFSRIRRDESDILAVVKKASISNDVQSDDKVGVAKKKKKPNKVSAKIVDFDETDVGKMRDHRDASVSASSDTRDQYYKAFMMYLSDSVKLVLFLVFSKFAKDKS